VPPAEPDNLESSVTELDVEEPLAMTGSLPPDLEGLFVRNGPNRTAADVPWCAGDGMVHSVGIRAGRATSYRNRWIRTEAFSRSMGLDAPHGPRELGADATNANVVFHAGRLLALGRSGLPIRLTARLATLGTEDFDGMLTTGLGPHPRHDARTGSLSALCADPARPDTWWYHELDADGLVVHAAAFSAPGFARFHDVALSGTRIGVAATAGGHSRHARGGAPTLVGVAPRGGSDADVTWIDTAACEVLHVANAFDEGDALVLDVTCYDPHAAPDPLGWLPGVGGTLERWRVTPADATVERTVLDERWLELPVVDATVSGDEHRYTYCTEFEVLDGVPTPDALVRVDHRTGDTVRFDPGDRRRAEGAVFVRDAQGNADDEGWIFTLVYDAARDKSELVVLDGSRFGGPPAAVVELPSRVPRGMHATWVPAGLLR
jgi:carotenoid cleavage dioxygenase-like enzyme